MSLCINPQCERQDNSDSTIFCHGCGSELLLDGRYRVFRELGQGGFGTAYEAIDFNSRSWVLKVLTDNHPKYVELFQQEAKILDILNHSGIPKIDLDGYFTYLPNGSEEPLHCLVMEKIEGLNLAEYIKQRGDRPIKSKRALRWLLASYIGPMANIICKRTVRQNPNVSKIELCQALAKTISNPQQAKDFQQRLI